MSYSCDNDSLKIKISASSSIRALARKRVTPKARSTGVGKVRAYMSVVYRGFPRGAGITPDVNFGASNFGNTNIDPSLYVKTFAVNSNLAIRSTKVTIRRAPANLNESIYDVKSDGYIIDGNNDVSDGIYFVLDRNNSTTTNNIGPLISWSLSTEKRRSSNSRFIARASVPVNNLKANFKVESKIKSKYFEKLHGFFDQIRSLPNYLATEKLYPIRDVDTFIPFVNEKVKSSGLYNSVNEGIFIGNITHPGMSGAMICNDDETYITPSSIYTEGRFTYQCEVNPPSITPIESFLFIRAAAPIFNYETDLPPIYKVSNITFTDPSGNLIAKYKDFEIRGEQNYELKDQYNFITYVTEPEINNAKLNTWKYKFPKFGEPSGYKLNLEINGDCFYKPFTEGFTEAFEHDCDLDSKFVKSSTSDHLAIDGVPLSTRTSDYFIPTNALRISAIEFNNKGRANGLMYDNMIPMVVEVVEKGNRIVRSIKPSRVLGSSYQNSIYPTNTINIWKTSPDIDGNIYYNSDTDGKSQFELTDRLNNLYVDGHITLEQTSPVPHSGKLQLLYEHKPPFSIKEQRGGAFNFGNKYENGFNKSAIEVVYGDDSFFVVEEISLKILARKAPNTPDFPIDVVGYSNDGVMVSTKQVGGFLQNKNAGLSGSVPRSSGFYNVNELAMSANTYSEKESYYDVPITNVEAGDHYNIENNVLVNTTDFAVYDIPLKIYSDPVTLGRSKDYSMSTYFESLYLDIYPIPSGASIAAADLVVKYKPTAALKLSTVGSPKEYKIATRKNTLHTCAIKDVDSQHNKNIERLSSLLNLPHAYETKEDTLKTNYSRRWRGSSGQISIGAFDPNSFGFSFSFPQINMPFVSGYIDFNTIYNNAVLPSNGSDLSGVFSNPRLEDSIVNNLGWRFNSNTLFTNNPDGYKTIDWTSSSDDIYGQILDAFDSAIRISGVHGHLDFGNTKTSEGFAIFTRFSPDYSVSGVGYNLWNSGVLFQKQDLGEDLEYGLQYQNGHLCGFARSTDGDIISVTDPAPYDVYQYPLSVLLTYNANNNRKLSLYTQNEIFGSGYTSNKGDAPWPLLRDRSDEFILHSGDSSLTFGYSQASGVGFNCFITDIGISGPHPSGGSNLVDSSPLYEFQQDSIDIFFDGHTVKFWEDQDPSPLWKFVDERTADWNLGAFKYCEFQNSYDIMKNRVGKDYIYHTYYHDGLTYTDRTNIPLPESIIASGLSYHSQLENDMLRFNLDGREKRFYAIAPRISKDLPRSYIFDDDSIEVHTVIQQESDQEILWSNGESGAKVIVSLYTPAKESVLFPSKNYGLINRHVHYINSRDCWSKIKSTFTIQDFKDNQSEPWAYFDKTITKQEFQEKYFSREIDEMFVQYDVVYPSGSYNYSQIKIHSLDVSLQGALQKEETLIEQISFYSDSEAYREYSIDLYSVGYGKDFNNKALLYTSGIAFTPTSGELWLYSSGIYNANDTMPLYSITVGTATSAQGGAGLYYGASDNVIGLNLISRGGYSKEEAYLNLYGEYINPEAQSVDNYLNLVVPDSINPATADSEMFLYMWSENESFTISSSEGAGSVSSSLSLNVLGPSIAYTTVDASLNLLLDHRIPRSIAEDDMPLYLFHKKPVRGNGLEAFNWNSDNVGTDIDSVDNKFTSIPADDEIRGVRTICYGGCQETYISSCSESIVRTHDTTWYVPDCVDGGVIRSLITYSNPDVLAYNTDEPYDNHFYGIRKFTGLIPQAPYNITITGKTGSDAIIEVPRQLSEWEYGKKDITTGDDNENVNYSGIKLTAPDLNIASNARFAKDLTVLRDMVIVSSHLEDSQVGVDDLYNNDTASYNLDNAGKIYVYKKLPEPSGSDWSEQSDKSSYILDQEIVLPTGFRRDYFTVTSRQFTVENGPKITATIRNWQNIGEGRELGYSLDSAVRNNTDVIVAGAPGTKWTRTFPPLQTTPVTIALFVFNNELVTNTPTVHWSYIKNKLKDKDILYRYFADPPVEFDIKIILCEPMLGINIPFTPSEDFNYPQPDFIRKYLTHRHFSLDYNSQAYADREALMLNELIDIYHENFPIDTNALRNGMPVMAGFYIDNSRSLGAAPLGYFTDGLRSGVMNKFIDFIKTYTKQNGLQDFAGNPESAYVDVNLGIDENWIYQSAAILDKLTDIETLQNNGAYSLIANRLGAFNANAEEFNNPPASGGAVFVFENNGSGFEVSQMISSPSTYTDDVSDRFGHDVAISEDGKTIVIGSPYCDSAVQVWQYDDYYESNLLSYIRSSAFVSFLKNKHDKELEYQIFGEAYNLYNQYNQDLLTSSSLVQLRESTYNSFSETLKFDFRRTYQINPYNLIKNLTYSDIYTDSGGAWSTFYNNYIPTARAGYSVDVNEDGSLVAIGCPTDSLGERDDVITWFRYNNKYFPLGEQTTPVGGENWQWQNYTNAGSVRLLESRDYHPHENKVVEYYKFGNLHELLSPVEDADFFEPAMRNIYSSYGYEYSRTSFSEDKKIPKDAGLAFIITPAINAASDEIIANIQEWLAYGDRHLVLVGNDPKWENDGAYESSNSIINYILSRLDINMRIYEARNSYEALIEDTNTYYNVRHSFVPAKTTRPIASASSLRGYGVGDIRFYDPGKSDLYTCSLPPNTRLTSNGELTTDYSDPFAILENIDLGGSSQQAQRKKTYRELHNLCEMPIVHEGDLRAKYLDQCIYRSCTGDSAFLDYEHNLALLYKSHTTCNDWGCTACDEICPSVPSVNYRDASEPIPIMVAYEAIQKTVVIPPTPASIEEREVIVGYEGKTSHNFNLQSSYSGIDFMWSADSGNYTSLEYNINSIESRSLFYDPEEYNGLDAILQAKSNVPLVDVESEYIYSNKVPYAVEEAIGESKVVLIAGILTESREALLYGSADQNLNLYFNILARNAFGGSKVAQIGGFTGRTSYQDGYFNSDIQNQMVALGIDMLDTNVSLSQLNDETFGYNVAWIANTDQYPSSEDVAQIKRFLESGDKKLVITYGQDPQSVQGLRNSEYSIKSAKVAEYLCSELGISMKPMFLNGKNKYASLIDMPDFEFDSGSLEAYSSMLSGFDKQSRIGGDGEGALYLGFNCRLNERNIEVCDGYYHEIIPIDPFNGNLLLAFQSPIWDIRTASKGVQQFHTGITKVTFDVPEPREDVPEEDDWNLFRLYFRVVCESDLEKQAIQVYIPNCSTYFQETKEGENPLPSQLQLRNAQIKDTDDQYNVTVVNLGVGLSASLLTRSDREYEFNVQLGKGANSITMYFTGFGKYQPTENPPQYRTVRLASVSGVRIPVEYKFSQTPIFEIEEFEVPGVDGYEYDIELIRQISTSSDKYCIDRGNICDKEPPIGYGADAPEIADGPMVVAQGVYHQAGFFAGYNKSRVTVISDSSLIQGRTILREDQGGVNAELIHFLINLYPETYFEFINSDVPRQYPNSYKIISPERASPSRLINAYPENSGLNYRFGQYESNSLSLDHYSDTEGKKKITPETGKTFVAKPFNPMMGLMSSYFPFNDPPKAPQLSPSEFFGLGYLINGMNKEEYERYWYKEQFEQVQEYYSSTSKFKDFYSGVYYEDAGYQERIPQILRETGKDHLDFEIFPSGYPGELFGYDVKLHKDKLYVGTPFTPYHQEQIVNWPTVVNNSTDGIYGSTLGFNGGAGAVYVIEKTGNIGQGAGSANNSIEITEGIPWDITRKLRPEELSVGYTGIDSTNSQSIIGSNSYSDEFLSTYAHTPDMFGSKINLAGDLLAISAPGHNFETYFEYTAAEFMRKEFNEQFDITKVIRHDLADEQNRITYQGSGDVVLNHGAVFTYENRISDWGSKEQDWVQIHKVVSQGTNARVQNSGENMFFGNAIGMYRSRRNDADYILAIGSERHQFPTNNEAATDNAGAAFTYDGVLRKLRPAFSHPDSYISGRVYGEYQSERNYKKFHFTNGQEANKNVFFEGRVLATIDGEIFIEASGQDKINNGYVVHRPYIESIRGSFAHGTATLASMNMTINGVNPPVSGTLNLVGAAPLSGNVYNSLDFVTYNAVRNSGELLLYSSGVRFEQLPQTLYSEAQLDSEEIQKANSINGVSFLVGRGGFRART